MKRILIVCAFLALSGCSLWDEPSGLWPSRAHVSGRYESPPSEEKPVVPSGPDLSKDTVIYYSGVEFPEDYDWHKDSAYANVRCRLVVFAGDRRVLEIPAGPDALVSQDADGHRLMGGHLYAERVIGSQTVVSRDGEELFRYEGDEIMRGFSVHAETVYTLGQNRGGAGFTLRENGNVIYEDKFGVVGSGLRDAACRTGALYHDRDKLCFSYYVPARVAGREQRTWYAVCDGERREVDLPDGVTAVHDVRMVGGDMWIAVSTEKSPLVLLQDGYSSVVIDGATTRVDYCRILVSQGMVALKVEGSASGKEFRKLFKADGSLYYNRSLTRIVDYAVDGDSYGFAVYSDKNKKITSIVRNGTLLMVQPPYFMASRFCADIRDDLMAVALSPASSGVMPAVWVNGKEEKVRMNGYLTSLEIKVN